MTTKSLQTKRPTLSVLISLVAAYCLFPSMSHADPPSYSQLVTFTGTIDDPNATVFVSSVPASINGGQFTADVLLQFGRNDITITADDEVENHSEMDVIVYLDLPESQKIYAITKTVSGTVGELNCTVDVNTYPATVTGTDFQYDLDLTYGANSIVAVVTDQAGNPNSHDIKVFVDAPASNGIPVINSTIPSSATIFLATQPFIITINATDDDPLTYRATLGSTVVVDWQSSATFDWTPTTNQLGSSALKLEASDGPNTAETTVQVYVVRPPLEP